MQFTTFVATALLATSALAAPRSTLEDRIARRASGNRQTTPPQFVEGPTQTYVTPDGNVSHVQYSSNWAGAVIESPPQGTFTAVSARFTVPKPSKPSGGSAGTKYAASAWVGIDGDTYGKAILQTGVDFYSQNGAVSYDCWYEWYPNYAYDFSGIPISAGDVMQVSVKSSSSSAGVATIENVTTGKKVTKNLNAPSSTSHLGGKNAEWIVEDFEEGSGMAPFADFGTVVFSNAQYTTSTGSTGGPGSATIIDIQQNGKVLTSASTTSNSVTVKYV